MKKMSTGNTRAALRLLSRNDILHLCDSIPRSNQENTSVLDILKSKHPPGNTPALDTIVEGAHNPPTVHPVIFDSIQAKTIRSAALHTNGAAGPSGIDARGWRRLCCSFKSASDDLCHSLALLTRRLCKEFVDPDGIAALMACRLIALEKKTECAL